MSDRKDELRLIINTARAELDAIESKEALATNRALLGKCFKYRNTYGGDGSESWWMYSVVVAVNGDGITLFNFQRDTSGRVFVEQERGFILGNHEPISFAELKHAWDVLSCHIEHDATLALAEAAKIA